MSTLIIDEINEIEERFNVENNKINSIIKEIKKIKNKLEGIPKINKDELKEIIRFVEESN